MKPAPRARRHICSLRASPLAAFLVLALPAMAQQAAEPAAPAGQANQEVVKMSQFEVTTTQGHGYVSTNAAAAFKTDESLMDIPQGDIVVTNDLIMDTGFENTTDVLSYFGASASFQGESVHLRGASAGYPYIDDMPVQTVYMDDAVVDSYEVIKGPTEALYLNAPLAGLVLKATKKPLPYAQTILTAQTDEWGLYRFTADTTGPIGAIGDLKMEYRFVGVYQRGKSYFSNLKDDREVLYPQLGFEYHNTSVRLIYDLQRLSDQIAGLELLTPSGALYTGGGRAFSNQPPGNQVYRSVTLPEIQVLQKISDSWETRFSSIYNHNVVYGGNVHLSAINWIDDQETFASEIYNQNWKYWSVLDDTTGKYEIGPANWSMKNVDSFGYGFTSWTNKLQYWTTAPFYTNDSITVPFNDPAAVNSIVVPPSSAYTPPANEGTETDTVITSIYWQHTISVIPNWLDLTGAWTWDNVSSTSISNISTLPYPATVVTAHQWLHRLGAVVHLTKSVSLYALDATAFTPPSGTSLLENAQLPPNVFGEDTELGLKWNLLGGKISGETAWYRIVSYNVTILGGYFPNGVSYYVPVGTTTNEGVDGDVAFTILPNWQVIGSWYAGHDLSSTSLTPVSGTYNNAWGVFTRYAMPVDSPLHGLSFGGGVNRVGSQWISDAALTAPAGELPADGIIKLQVGTLFNGFVNYAFNKHVMLKVSCVNILDQVFPLDAQTAYYADPSEPRTFTFEGIYKF